MSKRSTFDIWGFPCFHGNCWDPQKWFLYTGKSHLTMHDLGPHFGKAPLLPQSQSQGFGKRQDLPAAVGGGAVAATGFCCAFAGGNRRDPDVAGELLPGG